MSSASFMRMMQRRCHANFSNYYGTLRPIQCHMPSPRAGPTNFPSKATRPTQSNPSAQPPAEEARGEERMAAEGRGGGAATDVRVEAGSSSEPSATFSMSREDCVAGIRSALKHPTVRFLRERMEKAGCQVWPRFIQAATCSSAGGYASRLGIVVCCNNMELQDEINQVIIHELIHAYDDCVAKNLDWKNCAHHACSEIRANHLSGDCHYKRELLRGFMKIRGHEQDCVKRRALRSVKNNPYCSEAAAKDAIEAVWDICYNDTRPFDRAP